MFRSNWSAHAQLPAYLQGNAIYNACNFSLAPEWANNYGYLANSTATSTKVSEFACPSDSNANQQTNDADTYASFGSNNSYMAGMGTATIGYPEATPNPATRSRARGSSRTRSATASRASSTGPPIRSPSSR